MALLYFSISSTKKVFSVKKFMTINNRTIENNENMRNGIFFLSWKKNQKVKIIDRAIVVDGLMKKLQTIDNIIKKDE